MKWLLLFFSVIAFGMSIAHAQSNKRSKGKSHPTTSRGDSLKYFPKLLGDSMSIHFDPNKYLPRNTQSSTTALPAPVKDTIPDAITQRTTELVNTYQVSSPHIEV